MFVVGEKKIEFEDDSMSERRERNGDWVKKWNVYEGGLNCANNIRTDRRISKEILFLFNRQMSSNRWEISAKKIINLIPLFSWWSFGWPWMEMISMSENVQVKNFKTEAKEKRTKSLANDNDGWFCHPDSKMKGKIGGPRSKKVERFDGYIWVNAGENWN